MRAPFNIIRTLFIVSAVLGSCAVTETDRDLFLKADTDKDGRLSLAETNKAGLPRLFGRFDLDGNGSVSFEDVRKVEPDFERKDFDERDLNRDGRVSYAEYEQVIMKKGGLKPWFVQADQDGDGYITTQEAQAFHAERNQP